jgi:hypothetical protein
LFLASLIAGEQVAKALQLGIEYYPAPPFPERRAQDAPIEIMELVRRSESAGKARLGVQPPFQDMFKLSAARA